MSVTDPIADMLTIIRNAGRARKEKADVQASKLVQKVLEVLKKENYIRNFKFIKNSGQGILRVYLKFKKDKKPAIINIKRISKPGLRVYAKQDKIPNVLGGLGVAIISTSRGVLTDSEARQTKVGGEVICHVW